jgi:TonB family protein
MKLCALEQRSQTIYHIWKFFDDFPKSGAIQKTKSDADGRFTISWNRSGDPLLDDVLLVATATRFNFVEAEFYAWVLPPEEWETPFFLSNDNCFKISTLAPLPELFSGDLVKRQAFYLKAKTESELADIKAGTVQKNKLGVWWTSEGVVKAPPQVPVLAEQVASNGFVAIDGETSAERMQQNLNEDLLFCAGITNLFDINNLDQRPTPRVQPQPAYPYEMSRAGISGSTTVRFIIDENGVVIQTRIIRSSHRNFEVPALQAVSKWKFKAARKGGKAVKVSVTDTLEFDLGDRQPTPSELENIKNIGVNSARAEGGLVAVQQTSHAQPKERPRLASASLNRTTPLTTRLSGVVNVGIVGRDARWSEYGEYLNEMLEIIQVTWYRILEESRVSPPRGSHVVITFKINSKGEANIVKVEDADSGKQGVLLCQDAITYPQPYRKWTQEMIAALGDQQELSLAFYYQ